MKKRKLLATGSIVTTLLLANVASAMAEVAPAHPSSLAPSGPEEPIYNDFELFDVDDTDFSLGDLDDESGYGRSPKAMLQDQGFSSSQIKKLLKR